MIYCVSLLIICCTNGISMGWAGLLVITAAAKQSLSTVQIDHLSYRYISKPFENLCCVIKPKNLSPAGSEI